MEEIKKKIGSRCKVSIMKIPWTSHPFFSLKKVRIVRVSVGSGPVRVPGEPNRRPGQRPHAGSEPVAGGGEDCRPTTAALVRCLSAVIYPSAASSAWRPRPPRNSCWRKLATFSRFPAFVSRSSRTSETILVSHDKVQSPSLLVDSPCSHMELYTKNTANHPLNWPISSKFWRYTLILDKHFEVLSLSMLQLCGLGTETTRFFLWEPLNFLNSEDFWWKNLYLQNNHKSNVKYDQISLFEMRSWYSHLREYYVYSTWPLLMCLAYI